MGLPLWLWLPLALAAARAAAGAAGQSPLQRRVVRDVLDYFHGRSNVHFLFKERELDGVIEREDPSGTFVQLRLGLAQTTCRKRAPQRHCRVLEGRRKPTCLACYKFDTGDVPKVLDKYHNCGPSHHLAAKEIRQRDEAECRAVEEAGRAGDTPYLPGMFAFSRGLPA
ncbi:retinoic acid receptor responder protein 2 [Passer montanus]|uniref:retinoic acid receptor responder protein 2 n=1 Tax=Passer montanus TaxID=9160 RepID=UPI0019609738|nr:retinoic acid receptor responder protein 2 [Passer montanus]